MSTATQAPDDLIPTRDSLLTRLKNWEDQEGWSEFFETYWRLIYGVARKAGLSEADAQEVVQETILSVTRSIKEFRTGREHGSFKAWLLTIVRRRIADQFRKNVRDQQQVIQRSVEQSPRTDTIARIPDPNGPELETMWNLEWERNRTGLALERLQRKVSARQFQIFQMLATGENSPGQVARVLGINRALVYVTKHRLGKLFNQELKRIDQQG